MSITQSVWLTAKGIDIPTVFSAVDLRSRC